MWDVTDQPSDLLVRDARESDLPEILVIHNNAIAETTAIWDTELADLDERKAWFATRTGAGHPVLVAEIDGRVAGYASYGQFRPKSGYRFAVVDRLLTNFHLPKSTLLALVCAFAGTERVLDAYRLAVRERYRFFSYGDAMLLERAPS